MHYYQHNIADYRKDTIHLNLLEHGVYRQLLDQYYLTQKKIPLEDKKIFRLINARSEDEKNAIKNVINDFFIETEDGYVHKRCDIELENYRGKSEKAGKSAKIRWDANAMRTHSEGNANSLTHKPINSLTNINTLSVENEFNTFWNKYPKKIGKEKARIAWDIKRPILEVVLKALEWQKNCDQWFESGGKYIPNPTTWINEERWHDEPVEKAVF